MTGLERVLARRLATQGVTSVGAPDPATAVRLLLAVQAQDPPLSRYSVGLRTRSGADSVVRQAIDDGAILRTHILRPTWHLVASEDIRWLLSLTGARVESSTAARRRQLAIDEPPPRPAGRCTAVLLPRFDEAYLPYRTTPFSRVRDHPLGDRSLPLSEAGGGVAVHDLREVGHWKRTVAGDVMRVTLFLSPTVDDTGRDALFQAAQHLAAFTGHRLELS